MITREQVADLRKGDVVRVTSDEWPGGSAIEGPLTIDDNGFLVLDHPHVPGRYLIRDNRGAPYDPDARSLTVISRAPRPLYVNHPRPEPVPDDVVCDAGAIYLRSDNGRWLDSSRGEWFDAAMSTRLRLLVDGETRQVVPDRPAVDPLAHITEGDPTPEGANEDEPCGAEGGDWVCTREPDHPGQHIAGCGVGWPVPAVWS